MLEKETWLSFRGAEMIAIMKSLSLLFDLNADRKKAQIDDSQKPINIDFLSFFSYMISINTAVFGPWISYKQHDSGLKNNTHKVQ